MSLDAEYILDYICNNYVTPTPMDKDKKYLEENHGGEVVIIDEYILYYKKPKYRLLQEDIQSLNADRVFEKQDCDLLEIIK